MIRYWIVKFLILRFVKNRTKSTGDIIEHFHINHPKLMVTVVDLNKMENDKSLIRMNYNKWMKNSK